MNGFLLLLYVFFVNCKILFCASIWEGSCSTNSYLIEVGCMNLYHVVICLMDIRYASFELIRTKQRQTQLRHTKPNNLSSRL